MSSEKVTSVRDEYKLKTHNRILDAAIDLINGCGEKPLVMAAVAARAGVTERTIFRHFATREILLRETWRRMQSRIAAEPFASTADGLIGAPLRLYPRFDRNEEVVRASLYSRAGVEVRMSSNAERKEALVSAVRDALPTLDEAAIRRRAAVAQLIASAYGWEVLRQYWDISGEEAGRAASEALAILVGRRKANEE